MGQFRANPERLKRSRIFYTILTLFLLAITSALLMALQDLILPLIIGLITAYIAMPGLKWMMKHRIPRWMGVVILFGGFILVVFVIGRQVFSMFPDEKEQLELRVNIHFKLDENFSGFVESDSASTSANLLKLVFGDELRPIFSSVTGFLALNKDEESRLFRYGKFDTENPYPIKPATIRRYEYLKSNGLINSSESNIKAEDQKKITATNPFGMSGGNNRISQFLSVISNWILTPFVFIFILFDDGDIEHFVLGLIPNRYFEMALTTLDNVDIAIGGYLRGTLLECSMVGSCFILGLLLVGFDLQAAVLIGIVAGIANAIPFLGPVIGLVVGIGYSLIVETIDPIIPFISSDSAITAVLIVVLIVQILDNVYFQPVVLGKAVNLHPLVVIVGVSGGSIMFGFTGMLFAIPTIVVLNVVLATIFKQLKAYYIIY